MITYFSRSLLILFLAISFVSQISCVSKRKYKTELSRRTNCDSTLQQINAHNMNLNRQIANLKLQLAEKNGEANAFRELLDKQDQQINRMDKEIRQLTNQSQNQQASMDERLRKKVQELAGKEEILEGFRSSVRLQDQKMIELLTKVGEALPEYNDEDISCEEKNGLGYIRISESLLFKSGTTRLQNSAFSILEQIANVLQMYPEMDVFVIGHTDNKPVGKGSSTDNWDLSVLRATPIIRALTKDFGMNPNQVTAGGKGEFKPRASNETQEGREQNRRTELVIYPPTGKILQQIRESQ